MNFNKATVLFLLCAILVAYLTGCSNLKGDKPPIPTVSVGKTEVDVGRASYCWGSECVDIVVTPEILNNKLPTVVSPNSNIEVKFNYRPQPSTLSVTRINDIEGISEVNSKESIEEALVNGSFEAPSEPGVYYYDMLAHWLTKEGKHALGDSYYYFMIEVR